MEGGRKIVGWKCALPIRVLFDNDIVTLTWGMER